jgi:hypothetical protein
VELETAMTIAAFLRALEMKLEVLALSPHFQFRFLHAKIRISTVQSILIQACKITKCAQHSTVPGRFVTPPEMGLAQTGG